jgi:ADP-heptose:LPS heptosyltransferase
MQPKNKIREPKSIAIFRALMLGDLLCTVPSLRALRQTFPQTKMTLIGLPWAKGFAQRFSHLIDDFMPFPGYPGLPEITPDIEKIPAFFQEAQARKFDVALQMHGSGSYVNSIVSLFGAAHTGGFFFRGEYCPKNY